MKIVEIVQHLKLKAHYYVSMSPTLIYEPGWAAGIFWRDQLTKLNAATHKQEQVLCSTWTVLLALVSSMYLRIKQTLMFLSVDQSY